jgi:hypothetical protein
MSQSTPLDKIENDVSDSGNTSDAMRVQRILQEINGGGDEAPGQQQAPPHMQQPPQHMQQPPMYQDHPNQGAPPGYHMYQPPHSMPPQQLMGPGMVPFQHEQMMPPRQQQQHEQEEQVAAPPLPAKKNVWAHITDALKLPVVVAFVFFLLSLPMVDVTLSKYAHWAFSSGGQLSLPGIALKAVVAGTIMGIYDTLDNFVSRFF